jgi:hypothetical protein
MAGEYTGAVLRGRAPASSAMRRHARARAAGALPAARPACRPMQRLHPGGGAGAAPAAGLLHRLPGASDLHRDEAGRARTGPAPRVSCRHRLPPVLHPAAVQPRATPPWATASAGPARRRSTPASQARTISVMGDGGFWHNGLTSGVANAVFNKTDNLTVVVDNSYTAATGGQDVLSSQGRQPVAAAPATRSRRRCAAWASKWVRRSRTPTPGADADSAARGADHEGEGPQGLRRAERMHAQPPAAREAAEAPGIAERPARGARTLRRRPRHLHRRPLVHPAVGLPVADHQPNPDPLRATRWRTVIDSCVGCGLCGEVAHAAVLCPSFYRAQIVNNPGGWDRLLRACAAR